MNKTSRRKKAAMSGQKAKGSNRSRGVKGRARARRGGWIGFGAALTLVVVAAVLLVTRGSSQGATSASRTTKPASVPAPNGSFTTAAGALATMASLRGQPTLVWFVSTWCSSCQAGTQAMASAIPALSADHVRVVELELAGDLGQPGPSIANFARQYAGAAFTNRDWIFGVASSGLTTTYDPNNYLDIYYLVNASGHIVYVNGSPAATMGQLLSQAGKLRSA